MVQYKVLRQALVVITLLTTLSCSSQEKENKMNDDNSSVIFFGVTDTLKISKNNFKIVQTDYELEIRLNKLETIKKIEDIECNKVQFYINGKLLTAKSNPVFSSKVPNGAEYFFSTNAGGNLMNIKDEKTLYMRKIIK